MQVVSTEITERRVFVKAVSPDLRMEIPVKDRNVNDVVQYGLVISNSDVGSGSLRIEPMIHRLICNNGMIANTAMRKFHTGKNQLEEEIYKLLNYETIEKENEAFWMKVRDLILASMDEVNFTRQVEEIQQATEVELPAFKVEKLVDNAMKAVKITGEKKRDGILAALASGNEGAGFTKWGLVNSFTKAAHSVEGISYEDSIEMERAGGKILTLNKSQFQSILPAS